jgi:hypothetical protein
MIDPKELAKGGFGAAAALQREREAERRIASQRASAMTTAEPSASTATPSSNSAAPPAHVDETAQHPAPPPPIAEPKQP